MFAIKLRFSAISLYVIKIQRKLSEVLRSITIVLVHTHHEKNLLRKLSHRC